jgi:hypothetical protein
VKETIKIRGEKKPSRRFRGERNHQDHHQRRKKPSRSPSEVIEAIKIRGEKKPSRFQRRKKPSRSMKKKPQICNGGGCLVSQFFDI